MSSRECEKSVQKYTNQVVREYLEKNERERQWKAGEEHSVHRGDHMRVAFQESVIQKESKSFPDLPTGTHWEREA